MSQLAPIVLFTYNRLDETKRTVNALKNNFFAGESELYVFSDGWKKEGDRDKILAVRNFLNQIKGFKKITIVETQLNKGLANSIIGGVTDVIEKHGKVIVLEDDLITSPNFLNFNNQALDIYEKNDDIFSISGYTLNLPSLKNEKKDFYYGYRASSWGWATWKNRWENIDWEMDAYDELKKDKKLRKNLLRGGSDMMRMLKNQKLGKIDSWAIIFCLHQSIHNLKTVFPSISKVQSIGYSKDATHTVGTKRFITRLDISEQSEFVFSKHTKMDEIHVKEFKSRFSIKARAWYKLISFFNR